MKKFITVGILGLLLLGALGLVITGTALAQEDTPQPESGTVPGFRGGFGRGYGNGVGLEAAAEALGMTTDELSNRLWAGETLADLADQAGVDLQELRDAVEAAQVEAKREAIEQAVDDGLLTRDHADWLLEGLDNGYLPGFGRGGFGHGGFGHGGFGRQGGFGGMFGPGVQTPDTSSDSGA